MQKQKAEDIRAQMRSGYGAAALVASETRERLYGGELKRFVDYIRDKESILDVGCGDGRDLEVFKGKQVAYTGVDISKEVIEQARAKWKGEAVFEVGDILQLPSPDGRYDHVLALGVLHHVPSAGYRVQAIKELARVTRSGGYIMIATWNLWQTRYWGVLLHQLFGKRNGWDFGDLKITWKKPIFPRFYHVFTIKEMNKLCTGAGLEVVEQYYVTEGEISDWRHGQNLVTVARKP
jgi:SAM-dependent methyltransferase